MKENLTQPTTAQLEAEVARVSYRSRFGRVLRSTIYALVIVAAVAVLIATLWLPILQIYGSPAAASAGPACERRCPRSAAWRRSPG